MMKKSFLYKVLFLMLLVLGIGSQTIADAPSSNYDNPKYSGDIIGKITPCGSSEGVRVYIPGTSFEAITNAVGNFKMSYVPIGTYNLTVIQDGQNLGSIPNVTVVTKQVSDVGTVTLCLDNDGDGYTQDVDCNDSNALINPGAEEICNNKDDNCDGLIDNNATAAQIWYADTDQDGFGDESNWVEACQMPTGYTDTPGDCDDTDPNINPSHVEICNNKDDNCDGEIDNNAPAAPLWYGDWDLDGFGSETSGLYQACEMPAGINVAASPGDCDDFNADVNPSEPENCSDNIDNNCNGEINEGCFY